MNDAKKSSPPWMEPEEGDEEGQKVAEKLKRERAEGAGSEGEQADSGTSPEELERRVAELEEELRVAQERLLRVAADYENFRKRAKREQEEARIRGREEVLREILGVFDNLERAVEAAGEHAEEGAVKAIVEGVRMVQRQFADGMSRFGLAQFSALGKPFDPNYHEAMAQQHSEEHPPGAVVQEYQKGYMLGERLLRPAMVVVASPSSTGRSKQTGEGQEGAESSGGEAADSAGDNGVEA